MSDTPHTPPPPSVWPTVGFADVDAGIALLQAMGFRITADHRSDDGTVQHAEARWPDGGGVMFGTRGKSGDWGALGPQGVYVVAAEPSTVDAVHDRVHDLDGIEIVNPLEETDYDSRTFGFRDADGNLWSIGTYRGAP